MTAASEAETARQRDYCKNLCVVLMRYATDSELQELLNTLDAFKARMLQRRYCPGLNDAAYDLYIKFHLRGPSTKGVK
jgi:hypothetical protein